LVNLYHYNPKSNTMKSLISIILLSLLMSGCISQQKDNNPEIFKKGAEISGKLAKSIMTKLNSEIQENGLPGAINYCSLQALPITDSISKMEKVEISRVSHKFRNPINAANNKEIEMIEKYISQQQKGEQLVAQVVNKNGQTIYYSPIVLGSPLCLSCHGDYNKIDADVQKILSEKYPDDKAVNFNLNEIRGMFKIVFE